MTKNEEDITKTAEELSVEGSANDVENATSENGDDIEEQLQQALLQVDKYKNEALLAQAEMQNLRKRTERDVANAHKFSVEKIVAELLPVVDNLERGLEASQVDALENAAATTLKEGIELTLNLFVGALNKFNVAQIDPAGEPFDPQLHQAMTMIEQDSVEPNTVVDVMQKGYSLHGRLVRPAMVVVSKASESSASKIDEQA